jgi:hypothetical protein
MNQKEFTAGSLTLVRIQKATAKKLFEMGDRVYIQSCHLNPFNGNQQGFRLDPLKSFDKQVDEFTHWYCNSQLVGYRPSFYKKHGDT